jgi:hypothetical protein
VHVSLAQSKLKLHEGVQRSCSARNPGAPRTGRAQVVNGVAKLQRAATVASDPLKITYNTSPTVLCCSKEPLLVASSARPSVAQARADAHEVMQPLCSHEQEDRDESSHPTFPGSSERRLQRQPNRSWLVELLAVRSRATVLFAVREAAIRLQEGPNAARWLSQAILTVVRPVARALCQVLAQLIQCSLRIRGSWRHRCLAFALDVRLLRNVVRCDRCWSGSARLWYAASCSVRCK